MTDELGLTVQPVKTIKFNGQKEYHKAFSALAKIICDSHPHTVVVGLPLNIDDTKGNQIQKVNNFINGLKKYLRQSKINPKDIQWQFCDERYTSEEAKFFFIEHNVPRSKRKDLIDTFAAVFILKRFLAEQND